MKRKKNTLTIALICIICIFIVAIINLFNRTQPKTAVKVGIIDSYIPEETLDLMNITNINYTANSGETNNNHGKVTLKLIQNECKYSEIYYASVLDEDNTSSIENVISAIDWCIENKVDIICMSFATFTDDNLLRQFIKKAIDNNIIITASCINLSNNDCYPAMYDNVISVSEGLNKNATIIMKNKKFRVKVDGKVIERTGTSVSNAYICGRIARELSKENSDIKEIVSKIRKQNK